MIKGLKMSTLLSFVIPCYRSENTIESVIEEIIATVAQRAEYDYEIIAINDCSPDGVLDVLKRLAMTNKKIKIISFAINAGKHTAVLAGYRAAKGKYIVNLDDDLQCPTYELWKLLEPLERDDCDVVTARYHKKMESRIKRLGSDFNMWVTNTLLGTPKDLRTENFSCCKSFVCKEMAKYKHIYPNLSNLLLKVTRRIVMVPMCQRGRGDDLQSGFTFAKSVELFLNGLTAFSTRPLRLMTYLGFLVSFVGMMWGGYVVIRKILHPDILAGYSSLIGVNLFIGGVLMIMLGVVGEYVGRIFLCINSAQQYVVREEINT